MQNTKEIGNKGEILAKDFLINKGYKIRECNWRFGYLEIDIIAENNEYIVFFEIKTHSFSTSIKPNNMVSIKQQRNIIRAANYYIEKRNCNKEARFDIISIIKNNFNTHPNITHIEAAFTPCW